MKIGSEHASNLPRTFHNCVRCGYKGVYHSIGKYGHMLRCKYCKHSKLVERSQWLGLRNELEWF